MLYSCSIVPANIETGNGIIFYLDSMTTLTTTANIQCFDIQGHNIESRRSAKIILIGV